MDARRVEEAARPALGQTPRADLADRTGELHRQDAQAATERGGHRRPGQAARPPGRVVADDGPTPAIAAAGPGRNRTAPRHAGVTGAEGPIAGRVAARRRRRIAGI